MNIKQRISRWWHQLTCKHDYAYIGVARLYNEDVLLMQCNKCAKESEHYLRRTF